MKYIIAVVLMLMVVSTAGASGNTISYTVDGKTYEGYFISPSSSAPLILLVHDWDGLTDYEIKRAGMLADLGYSVFAVDLFGAGIRPTEDTDKRRYTDELYKNREKMRSLLRGALETAKSKGADTHHAVAMGYCFGGTAVLEFARSGVDLKGFVAFHGGLSIPTEQDYSRTKGKLLILHGTADTGVSMDDFAKLAMALEDKGISHEMITYSGAPHAFTVFGSSRYREDADKKSWKRFTEFLAETLGR
ncbi:MAG: dienelactone hydrolase family protein [Desulfatirhabdiaceae bacterium]